MSPREAKAFLRQLEEEVADSVTGPDGRFRKADFEATLGARLAQPDIPPEVRALISMDAVRARVRNFGERHRPKRDKDGNVIFDPRTVWKLGNGDWVRAGRATAVEGLMASRQSSLNRGRVNEADTRFQIYMSSRLAVFELNAHIRNFEELERTFFGYVEVELPFEDTDEDGADE